MPKIVSNDSILQKIKDYYRDNGKVPTSKVSWSRIVKSRFGSWNNAIIAAGLIPNARPRQLIKCLTCGKTTHNKKFCSKSCSAKYTNSHYIKRPAKIKICKRCGRNFSKRNSKYCYECSHNGQIITLTYTVGQVKAAAKYQKTAVIRSNARYVYVKSGLPLKCSFCGYSRHVEICHIRPISSFSDSSLLSEVNDIKNLIPLCPTHHWEFDNHFISDKELESLTLTIGA